MKRVIFSVARHFSKHLFFYVWRTHGKHTYVSCPGPERFQCSPLRSETCWENLLTWYAWRKNIETVGRWAVFLYVQVLLHKAQHKHTCPSCDCVINSLNWVCCDFEVTHGRPLWYTAGFSWGTPRDAWNTHTHKHTNIFHYTSHTQACKSNLSITLEVLLVQTHIVTH